MALATGTSARWSVRWCSDTVVWANLHEPCLKPLWISMLQAGKVGWRTRLLDVGCGTGGAVMLARGLGAALTGIEPDPERARFANYRNRLGTIECGPTDRLPFEDGAYSFVMSTDLISHPHLAEGLLSEMRRVCDGKGHVALGVWGDPAECDQTAVFEALEDEEAMADLVGDEFEWTEIPAAFEYPSVEDAWAVQRQCAWGERAVERLGEDEARERFERALAPYLDSEGAVHMHNRLKFVLL